MKTMSRAISLPVMLASMGLVSCATVGKIGQNSVAFVKNTASATTSKVTALSEMAADKIHPAGVQVVEVREKDLKKLPTGQERAIAFENTRKQGFFSFFNGPVDFKEPTLPQPGGELDGSLLPPKDN